VDPRPEAEGRGAVCEEAGAVIERTIAAAAKHIFKEECTG